MFGDAVQSFGDNLQSQRRFTEEDKKSLGPLKGAKAEEDKKSLGPLKTRVAESQSRWVAESLGAEEQGHSSDPLTDGSKPESRIPLESKLGGAFGDAIQSFGDSLSDESKPKLKVAPPPKKLSSQDNKVSSPPKIPSSDAPPLKEIHASSVPFKDHSGGALHLKEDLKEPKGGSNPTDPVSSSSNSNGAFTSTHGQRCIRCNETLASDAKFCSRCGQSTAMAAMGQSGAYNWNHIPKSPNALPQAMMMPRIEHEPQSRVHRPRKPGEAPEPSDRLCLTLLGSEEGVSADPQNARPKNGRAPPPRPRLGQGEAFPALPAPSSAIQVQTQISMREAEKRREPLGPEMAKVMKPTWRGEFISGLAGMESKISTGPSPFMFSNAPPARPRQLEFTQPGYGVSTVDSPTSQVESINFSPQWRDTSRFQFDPSGKMDGRSDRDTSRFQFDPSGKMDARSDETRIQLATFEGEVQVQFYRIKGEMKYLHLQVERLLQQQGGMEHAKGHSDVHVELNVVKAELQTMRTVLEMLHIDDVANGLIEKDPAASKFKKLMSDETPQLQSLHARILRLERGETTLPKSMSVEPSNDAFSDHQLEDLRVEHKALTATLKQEISKELQNMRASNRKSFQAMQDDIAELRGQVPGFTRQNQKSVMGGSGDTPDPFGFSNHSQERRVNSLAEEIEELRTLVTKQNSTNSLGGERTPRDTMAGSIRVQIDGFQEELKELRDLVMRQNSSVSLGEDKSPRNTMAGSIRVKLDDFQQELQSTREDLEGYKVESKNIQSYQKAQLDTLKVELQEIQKQVQKLQEPTFGQDRHALGLPVHSDGVSREALTTPSIPSGSENLYVSSASSSHPDASAKSDIRAEGIQAGDQKKSSPSLPPASLHAKPQDVMNTAPMDSQGDFQEGDEVRLHGLQASALMNGKIGILGMFDGTSGRWKVLFPDGGLPSTVKPENLLLLKRPGNRSSGEDHSSGGMPSASGAWSCSTCTFLNDASATNCEMCGSLRSSGVTQQQSGNQSQGTPPPPASSSPQKDAGQSKKTKSAKKDDDSQSSSSSDESSIEDVNTKKKPAPLHDAGQQKPLYDASSSKASTSPPAKAAPAAAVSSPVAPKFPSAAVTGNVTNPAGSAASAATPPVHPPPPTMAQQQAKPAAAAAVQKYGQGKSFGVTSTVPKAKTGRIW